MFRGLYSAASALEAASRAQDVTAHNLAHANTPGYRQRGVTYETFDQSLNRSLQPAGDIAGTRITGGYSDFRAGPLQQTGNPLDLALAEPDRFFSVVDGNGRALLTRDGSFHRNTAGLLVSTGGYALQGEAGGLTVPPTAGEINIAADGSVTADGAPIGRVRVQRVGDLKQLVPVGDALFEAPDAAGAQPADGRVLQGHREGSNVNPAEAMTGMVLAARYYDATQRALRAIAETVQLNTRPS
jgi:flagellar basal-body rod protein FlgF